MFSTACIRKSFLLPPNSARGEKKPLESGEAYAHDIIGDLNNWVSAWVDWNMLLDEKRRP